MNRTITPALLVALLSAPVGLSAHGGPGSQPAAGSAQPPSQTAQRPRTSSPGRPTLAIEVVNPLGDPLADVAVTATGPVDRAGETNAAGTVRLTNLRAGTYRVRFERDGSITLEREVTLRASGVTQLDVTLNEAPAPPPPPEPPAPVVTPAPARPIGEYSTTDVPAFVERSFIGRNEPVKVSPLGCTGYATSRLIQLRDPLDGQVHTDADESLYVVAGEVALGVDGRGEQVLGAGSFATVPRGTTYSLTRRGRNPPILVSVLSGPPCDGARQE